MAESREYVAGLLFCLADNCVWLIAKTKPEWQAGLLNAVGGKIEPGETPIQAMNREFLEETGIGQEPQLDWTKFLTLYTDHSSVVHFFRASQFYADKRDAVQTTEEAPYLVEVKDVLLRGHNTVPNIAWIVQMAHISHSHDWPYAVMEKVDTTQP